MNYTLPAVGVVSVVSGSIVGPVVSIVVTVDSKLQINYINWLNKLINFWENFWETMPSFKKKNITQKILPGLFNSKIKPLY